MTDRQHAQCPVCGSLECEPPEGAAIEIGWRTEPEQVRRGAVVPAHRIVQAEELLECRECRAQWREFYRWHPGDSGEVARQPRDFEEHESIEHVDRGDTRARKQPDPEPVNVFDWRRLER